MNDRQGKQRMLIKIKTDYTLLILSASINLIFFIIEY